MSRKADLARLEFVLSLIDDIELITNRHGSVEEALNDKEGFHALMMCCEQIGETLNKIESENYRTLLPVSLAYALRNVIAHNYIGISIKRMSFTLTENIPELKKIIKSIQKEIE